jgi:hypothetical protein
LIFGLFVFTTFLPVLLKVLFVKAASASNLPGYSFVCAGSDEGCNGGLMDNAFEFIIKMGGITSEEAYPYISGNGTTGTCVARLMKKKVAHISDYCDVTPNNETDLELAVNQQVGYAILTRYDFFRPVLFS